MAYVLTQVASCLDCSDSACADAEGLKHIQAYTHKHTDTHTNKHLLLASSWNMWSGLGLKSGTFGFGAGDLRTD